MTAGFTTKGLTQVNVRLSEELKLHLDRLGGESGLSASMVAQLVLTDALRNIKSVKVDFQLERTDQSEIVDATVSGRFTPLSTSRAMRSSAT
jgi:hypothetical protein